MTDKQIMIDGVDVSKCTCFDDGECLNPCETVTVCEASINCRYKQLKRKEQECETLASQLDFEVQKKECLEQECERWKSNFNGKVSAIEELLKQLDQLKAENEELKTGLKQIQKQFGIEILYCKTTGESTFRSTEILKLKQTLTEIKEIAETCMEINDCTKYILQKISECEMENE